MDQYQLIDNMLFRINEIADASGILRVALLYELYKTLQSLKEGLKKRDSAHQMEKELLEKQIKQMQKNMLGENVSDDQILGGQSFCIDFTKNNGVEANEIIQKHEAEWKKSIEEGLNCDSK